MGKNSQYPKQLTDKQEEFMRYIAQGLSNRAIAQIKGTALQTADQMVERLKNKLGMLTKDELKKYAIEHGYGEQA